MHHAQINQFTGPVLLGIVAVAVLYVWTENRHRRREAQRKAETERRRLRQREYLEANRRHLEAYLATRTKGDKHG